MKLTNSTARLEFKPLPCDDPQKRQPDISLARERLGWEPGTALEEGLRHTIKYFEAVLSGAGRTRSPDEGASRSVA